MEAGLRQRNGHLIPAPVKKVLKNGLALPIILLYPRNIQLFS